VITSSCRPTSHTAGSPDPNVEAVVVICRTTKEAIVVNLGALDWAEVGTSALGRHGQRRMSPGPTSRSTRSPTGTTTAIGWGTGNLAAGEDMSVTAGAHLK
jgi:hypothetical protein